MKTEKGKARPSSDTHAAIESRDLERIKAEMVKNLEDFNHWTEKIPNEKIEARKAIEKAFTSYAELGLIKDVRLLLKLAHENVKHSNEKAELLEAGFLARKQAHADKVALKVAELHAEIGELQLQEYSEA